MKVKDSWSTDALEGGECAKASRGSLRRKRQAKEMVKGVLKESYMIEKFRMG